MNKTKNKIDLSSIAGLKSDENWGYNSPKKLHHSILDEQETKVIEKAQLSLTNQTGIVKMMIPGEGKDFNAARNSGQRAFAKKISRKSHYITKK